MIHHKAESRTYINPIEFLEYLIEMFFDLNLDCSMTITTDFFHFRIAEEKKNEGNDQYKAQNYQAALRLYSDAISLCPNAAAFYGNRAACHMMLFDHKAALQDSRHAISLDDKFEKGYVRIAKSSLAMGDVVAAEQAINRLLEIDPKTSAVKIEQQQCKLLRQFDERAFQCYEKRDYRTAVFHADGALKIAPACMRFKLLKAESLALLGRTDVSGEPLTIGPSA